MALYQLYQGFRDPLIIKSLAQRINQLSKELLTPIYIMEVCGGHTHTIMKYALPQLLPNNIHFIHGPGCPVCIIPKERIDHAITMALQPDVILVTLGDMIRVPGSRGSLAQFRAEGADIRSIYDPLDALKIAQQHPNKTIVFFAIGFETSTPMTAILIEQTIKLKLTNLLFHINHVLVPPAINALMQDSRIKVNAFIGPAHVSVITGAKIYQSIVDLYNTPIVVSGFEPVDVLESILLITTQMINKQKNNQHAQLEIQYKRVVTYEGNVQAQQKIAQYFNIRPFFRWRGLGDIANSALQLKESFSFLDAELFFIEHLSSIQIQDHKACQCSDILKGLCSPTECKVFNRGCTPETPLGSCMVSSEGACNAYFRYQGISS